MVSGYAPFVVVFQPHLPGKRLDGWFVAGRAGGALSTLGLVGNGIPIPMEATAMKKFVVAGIAALALWCAPALAADMPMKAAPAPIWNWTGFYVGVAGGYGSGETMHVNQVTSIGSGAARVNGAILGGTYGYNVQSGMWVYGLEGDFPWSDIKSTFFSV